MNKIYIRGSINNIVFCLALYGIIVQSEVCILYRTNNNNDYYYFLIDKNKNRMNDVVLCCVFVLVWNENAFFAQ
jgi:hypothetical protein